MGLHNVSLKFLVWVDINENVTQNYMQKCFCNAMAVAKIWPRPPSTGGISDMTNKSENDFFIVENQRKSNYTLDEIADKVAELALKQVLANLEKVLAKLAELNPDDWNHSNTMTCADCGIKGIIGRTLFGRAAGMIPNTHMNRVDYLCAVCTVKMPIDKQQKADDGHPF